MNRFANMDKNQRILTAFIVGSLFFHLCFSLVHLHKIEFFKTSKTEKPEQRILLKLVQSKKANQIVEKKTFNNQKSDKPKFLSKANNSAFRQTKSRFVDKYKVANKGVRNATKTKRERAEEKTLNKKLKNIKLSDLAVKSHEKFAVKKKKKKQKRNSQILGLKNGKKNGRKLGSSNDYLEDIPLGDFTKLNTQEYEFYGFYHRIRQKLEQFWGNNIQEEAEKIFKQGRSIASESNLITGLTIKLNSNGEIVDIILKSTSGIKELDDAAVKSFNQAGPFPNPPKGMIKADGKAIIEWGFVVNT